jgi:hypothetical protein
MRDNLPNLLLSGATCLRTCRFLSKLGSVRRPRIHQANGAAIRLIRERSGLSVRDLVACLAENGVQVHPDHIRNIELGYRQPSEVILAGIARALRAPQTALISDSPMAAAKS